MGWRPAWIFSCVAWLAAPGCNLPSSAPIEPSAPGARILGPAGRPLDKLDLLFVVDNSPSMADAQKLLAQAIPTMLARVTHDRSSVSGIAPAFRDVHVGVITSSLGSHGTGICAPSRGPHLDDRAHLLPRSAACGLPSSSALRWTFGATDAGATELSTATACVIESAGDDGCVYPETWEAAYRFLADPKPYATANVKCALDGGVDACGSNKIYPMGVDDALLAERVAFLRQDSILAVVIVSDRNDASLKPAGLNWLPWSYEQGRMPRGWSACSSVPDDFEPESALDFEKLHSTYHCHSCLEDPSDPNCTKPWGDDSDVDARGLRAFEQTRRFGYSFLHGRARYVSMFTQSQVLGSDGLMAPNPIFRGGFRTRDAIVVAGLVGVPDAYVTHDGGAPKDPTEADWEKLIGPIEGRDPHMIESIGPRTGLPEFAGDRSVDPIHGGERENAKGDDLQYACIAPRPMTNPEAECAEAGSENRDPLCDAGAQPYFKAYPGLRHLRILHDLGASRAVASICSETFVPALEGIADRLVAKLHPICLSSDVEVADGRASCTVFESLTDDAGGLRCEDLGKGLCTPGAAPCRVSAVSPEKAAEEFAFTLFVEDGVSYRREVVRPTVDGANLVLVGSDGKRHLLCELQQLVSPDPVAERCLHDPSFAVDPKTAGGFCYATDPAVLAGSCGPALRYGGGAIPRDGAVLYNTCLGGR